MTYEFFPISGKLLNEKDGLGFIGSTVRECLKESGEMRRIREGKYGAPDGFMVSAPIRRNSRLEVVVTYDDQEADKIVPVGVAVVVEA